MPVKVLMIDDHPSQIEGYKMILSVLPHGIEVESTCCYNCESAYKIITSPGRSDFDVVFLDRSLPPYPEYNLKSGEDLAAVIKQYLPHSLIVIITSHAEAFVLYDIVKRIQPAGLLVKSDFKAEELQSAFHRILNGERYLSETVESSIRELLSKETYLDNYNRQIIMLLSQGVKTKSLPNYLHISLSAVEKRKAQVRDYLCLDSGGDEDIVREAKRRGFI